MADNNAGRDEIAASIEKVQDVRDALKRSGGAA